MLAVSPAELAAMQTEAASMLDLPCTIQRKTKAPDGAGQKTFTYGTVATCNAGLSQPTAGQLQNYDFLVGSLSAWQVKLPVGTNVQTQDHLLLSGQTLEVQVLLNPRSYPALLTVLATEIKGV